MMAIISFKSHLLLLCALFHVAVGVDDYIDGSTELTCDPAADNCYIACTTCTNNVLNCPTGSNCDTCQLQCSGNDACSSTTIYGNACNVLNITLIDGNNAGTGLKIYAPENGNLYFKNIDTNGDEPFLNGRIHTVELDSSTHTNNVIININEVTGKGNDNEATDSVIYGQYSNYIELNCNNNANCDNVTLHCPVNSTLKQQEPSEIPCKVNCTDANKCFVNAYIESNGWEDDIAVLCEGSTTCDVTVFCNNGDTGDYCKMSASNVCDTGFGTLCVPTVAPTLSPTIPTKTPTLQPSDKPSNNPSNVPSDRPTEVPSNDPTESPTRVPSDSPSNNPTNKPSAMPSIIPTNNPIILLSSDIPTVSPSDEPSFETIRNNPSSTPSSMPSDVVVTTNNPTKEPTSEEEEQTKTDSSGDILSLIESNFVFLVIVCAVIFVIILILCWLSICCCIRNSRRSTMSEYMVNKKHLAHSIDAIPGNGNNNNNNNSTRQTHETTYDGFDGIGNNKKKNKKKQKNESNIIHISNDSDKYFDDLNNNVDNLNGDLKPINNNNNNNNNINKYHKGLKMNSLSPSVSIAGSEANSPVSGASGVGFPWANEGGAGGGNKNGIAVATNSTTTTTTTTTDDMARVQLQMTGMPDFGGEHNTIPPAFDGGGGAVVNGFNYNEDAATSIAMKLSQNESNNKNNNYKNNNEEDNRDRIFSQMLEGQPRVDPNINETLAPDLNDNSDNDNDNQVAAGHGVSESDLLYARQTKQ